MAARLNPRQDARSRAAIQTTQLIRRLNAFALAADDPCYPGKSCEMTDTQVRAALGLLRKTMPDLAVTQISGDPDRPVAIDFRWADALPTAAPVIEHEPQQLEVSFETNDADSAQ